MQEAAAIILCAGKGTRMNDNSSNKVCFDCAGIPVVCRIIDNMRAGGVKRFVVVTGHQAQCVMDALDGREGVVYAYQKEQKGTGHATMCGLKALAGMGYDGPVIISMGDKIVAPEVVRDMLMKAGSAKAVLSVEPLEANPSGGHIALDGDKFCGIVEFIDAAFMALDGVSQEQYESTLKGLGLNDKKISKVLALAEKKRPEGTRTIAGSRFTAQQILTTPYANAALYCFDMHSAMEAIGAVGSDNAQGEVYLTDTLEYFARRGEAVLYEIPRPEDLLTFSTKSELREISRHFMRTASQIVGDIKSGRDDGYFKELYSDVSEQQKRRYVSLLEHFIEVYGNEKVVITRAPGRVNIMGRHIDHRGGGVNMMAIRQDTVIVVSAREDDMVRITNVDPAYAESKFSISSYLSLADHDVWLDYLDSEPLRKDLEQYKGDWSNYVKSAALRFQFESENPLCGMNIAASGEIPVAAGLSSSSSIVVAVANAIVALNSLNIDRRRLIDLCGEGEWFVGSRGGAADHAAMICSTSSHITHLSFKPFEVGESAPMSDKYAIIVADSLIKSKKSEGSRDKFNAKVASYEFAFMMLKRAYPEYDLREFRDLAAIRPYSSIYRMLKILPEAITREELLSRLPEYESTAKRIFSNHADPGFYDLRGVALFGISECVRSNRCIEYLRDDDYESIGKLMKVSHDGDRVNAAGHLGDRDLESLAAENADVAMQPGSYGCSTEEIDALCDMVGTLPGVMGCELVGAGLGGCIIALVEKDKADSILSAINANYYDRNSLPRSAAVYQPGEGAKVVY